MNGVASIIASNAARIRERIDAACRRADRSPTDVRLIAVTKSARVEWIDAVLKAGIVDLGESRPQQLVERASQFGDKVRWHLVGHLQKNKVRKALPAAAWVHSVDSQSLLERIDAVAGELQLRPRILLEVNVSGEATKQGFDPVELTAAWPALGTVAHVEIVGLMTMAPLSDVPEEAQPTFRRLRLLRDELNGSGHANTLSELSMGMSGDFDVAVEEGATMVRIGTSLFEGLL